MIDSFVTVRCVDMPVVMACRVMNLSTSGFYEWKKRGESAREQSVRELAAKIISVHARNRRICGAPRIHAELRYGHKIRYGLKRVARLMRSANIYGAYPHRHKRPSDVGVEYLADLVQRNFRPDGPDQLWVTNITQHRTRQGWVY